MYLWVFHIVMLFRHNTASSYYLTCPAQPQRYFRKAGCTNPAKPHYTCLLNVLDGKNYESCEDGFPFEVKKGNKKIRRPGITTDKCEKTRYQPIPFTTDEFSKCMYSKSLCSEEGQVIANNGSSGYQDRTCRCDYRAGYTYIVEPRNKCECVPSEEDCSCYRKICPPGEELSRDYECRVKDGIYLTTCGAIIGKKILTDTGQGHSPAVASKYITDSSSRSYSSGGKAAKAMIIALVLLAFLLVVLLVDCRPHVIVMTVNIDENHTIYRDDTNHVYHVIEGCHLSVDCKIRSRIRIKSVKMVKVSPQRKLSNIAVKSVYNERNQIDQSRIRRGEIKYLRTTDSGEHRCILTNESPLPLNNVNTLTSKLSRNQILKYLTDFPSLSLETSNRITLCVHEIFSATDIEVNERYSGGSLEFTAAPKSKRKILSALWTRVVQPSPDLKLILLSHNCSTTYSIQNITLEDSGDYICFTCFMTAGDNTVQSHRFRLKVIPSESSHEKVIKHKEDDTYVQTSAVDRAMEKLRQYKKVVLKGREGTGKSKMCLEIASRCEDQYQYLPVMVTSKKDIKEEFHNERILYILDQSDNNDVDKFRELYRFLIERPKSHKAWTILTCRSLYEVEMDDGPVLDCDSILSSKEKEIILLMYTKKHNVGIGAAADCNYRQNEILDKNDIQVILDKDALDLIITTEPVQGFPLMAKKFCEDRKKLHLGEKFFTNPTKEVVDRIIELRESAIRDEDYELVLMFCLLVYVRMRKHINMKEIKIWYKNFVPVKIMFANQIDECRSFKECLKENSENSDQKQIQNIVNRMTGTYFKETDGVYEFIHPYMSKATFLSSQYFATYGLADCPIEDILEFIRSCKYHNTEEEMVLMIDKEYTDINILFQRLVREITIHSETVTLSEKGMSKELEKQARVCKYIYDEWVKLRDEEFCRKMFIYIDGVFSPVPDYKYTPQTWHMLCLMNHLACNGMDPWIYSIQDIPDMAVIFGLISASKNRYNMNEQKRKTFEILLELLGNCLSTSKEYLNKKSQSSIKLTMNDKLALQIDKYENTLFHYLCLYSEDEACQILDKYIQCINKKCLKECLQMKNKEMIQPIHLSVGLGKSKIVGKFDSVLDISMKDDKEGKLLLKQILQYIKTVNTENKDIKNMSAFDLDKNFDPEISRSVIQGSQEDFEKVLILFLNKWIEEP